MFEKWFAVTPTDLVAIAISAVLVYAAVLLYTRVVGLRSFSKMSAADFAMTIACGSNFDDVGAVVFESTGDVSVLHSGDDKPIEPKFFVNVIGAEHLFPPSSENAY